MCVLKQAIDMYEGDVGYRFQAIVPSSHASRAQRIHDTVRSQLLWLYWHKCPLPLCQNRVFKSIWTLWHLMVAFLLLITTFECTSITGQKRILPFAFLLLFIILYTAVPRFRAVIFVFPFVFLGNHACRTLSFLLLLVVMQQTTLTMHRNLSEGVKSSDCLMQLAWNNSYQMALNRLLPMIAIIQRVQGQSTKMEEELGDLQSVLKPLKQFNEFNLNGGDTQILQNYAQNVQIYLPTDVNRLDWQKGVDQSDKIQLHSKSVMQKKTQLSCTSLFGQAHEKCLEKTKKIKNQCDAQGLLAKWTICEQIDPFSMCQSILNNAKTQCSSSQDQIAGELLSNITLGLQSILMNVFPGSSDIVIEQPLDDHSMRTRNLLEQQHTIEQMHKDEQMISAFWSSLQVLVWFFFVLTIISSNNYVSSYKHNLQFDNRYISSYFRRIDARRRANYKPCLLPLLVDEKDNHIDTLSLKAAMCEKKERFSNTFLLFILLICSVLLYINFVFESFLSSVHDHFHLEYKYHSKFQSNVTVSGSGPIANMFRELVAIFHVEKHLNYENNSKRCLNKVSSISLYEYKKIIFLSLSLIIIRQSQHYWKRSTRLILSFLYPVEERKRILFLYNSLLISRKQHLKNLIISAKNRLNQQTFQTNLSFLNVVKNTLSDLGLKTFYKTSFGFAKFFKSKCFICFTICDHTWPELIERVCNHCGLLICTRCFFYLDMRCLLCDFSENSFTQFK